MGKEEGLKEAKAMSEYQQTEYVSLRNDLLFHMVFTKNKEALKGLLSVLLNIPKELPAMYADLLLKRACIDVIENKNDMALLILDAALEDYTTCIIQGYELVQSYYQRAQIYASLGDTENQASDLENSLKQVD